MIASAEAATVDAHPFQIFVSSHPFCRVLKTVIMKRIKHWFCDMFIALFLTVTVSLSVRILVFKRPLNLIIDNY